MSMKLTLTLQMDNAAFEPDAGAEASTILRKIARQVEDGITEGVAHDTNGNVVGTWQIWGKRAT